MLDLTGENLVTYLLREIKDIVSRNPRFRNLGGDAIIQTPNLIAWNDLQVEISTIQASGNRLSPDYFMCTQYGHAILAKLENKNGTFVEWVQELRNVEQNEAGVMTYPEPGVYYLNVDSVNEATREVELTMDKYTWVNVKTEFGTGSKIYFAPSVAVNTVTPVDDSIQYTIRGNTMYILSYTTEQPIRLQTPSGELTPGTQYWYDAITQHVLTEATVTGLQDIDIPHTGLQAISDQNGFVLRDGIDYKWVAADRIRLGLSTPPGYKLTGTFIEKVNPTDSIVMSSENCLNFSVGPEEALTEGQVSIRSTDGSIYTETDLTIAGDGSVWFNALIDKGEVRTGEVRVSAGQSTVTAKKLAQNPHIIPGLMVGIGDEVEVGDQVAILVSPDVTETYEVYGSKENVSFTINIRANDRLTASEIATSIRSTLLIKNRFNMESNGLTIFEISKSSAVEQKGQSGVATTTTYSLAATAAADWEMYVPLTTRIGYIDIEVQSAPALSWPNNPEILPRMSMMGRNQFVLNYS